MDLLDLTLPDAVENVALDEALLLEAESGRGGELLRLWEWPRYAVVLGSGGVLGDDVQEENCRQDGVPILRRSSGGGTVLLGPGCLCYSLILSYRRAPALGEIRPSYDYLLSAISDSLSDLLPGITIAGVSDLASEDRKFSGNAQQRKRDFLLHHGTLLYGFDLEKLGRYLKAPPRQPEYRQGRPHRDFVCNLPCTAEELRRRLSQLWQADAAREDWPREELRRLVEEKYSTQEWIRRR